MVNVVENIVKNTINKQGIAPYYNPLRTRFI